MNTQTTTTKLNAIIDQINNMTTDELINLHNQYCVEAKYYDEEIFGNDEDFFNTFFRNNPDNLARAIFYGSFNYNHKYIKFDGYGNLESFECFDTDGLIESPETIAQFCIDEENDLNGAIELPETDEE